ncbi:hypothetical protein HHK36_015681 [Tetracentron sinense]|uniref:Uncharacterized protein n=1 Tax=Tetracentron sinense TaxID=13715 RepID=A0A834Z5M5_TETSI|nr:hypothetical protein HHK36_015681 [Tetracentron sinense]
MEQSITEAPNEAMNTLLAFSSRNTSANTCRKYYLTWSVRVDPYNRLVKLIALAFYNDANLYDNHLTKKKLVKGSDYLTWSVRVDPYNRMVKLIALAFYNDANLYDNHLTKKKLSSSGGCSFHSGNCSAELEEVGDEDDKNEETRRSASQGHEQSHVTQPVLFPFLGEVALLSSDCVEVTRQKDGTTNADAVTMSMKVLHPWMIEQQCINLTDKQDRMVFNKNELKMDEINVCATEENEKKI